MGCGLTCIKYCVFTFNVIFLLAGLGVLGVGVWIRVDKTTFDPLLGNSSLPIVAYVLIAAGITVVLISLAGCCGAMQESKLILTIYFIFLLLIFIMQSVAGVLAFMHLDQVKGLLDKNIVDIIQTKYGFPEFKIVSEAVDFMHREFSCCGYHSPLDWKTAKIYSNESTSNFYNTTEVPRSCCIDINKERCNAKADGIDVFNKGCLKTLLNWAQANLKILGAVGIAIAMIQLFGMVFAICLCKKTNADTVY